MDFKKSVKMAYFPTHDGLLKDRWTRLRLVAEKVGLSTLARQKLEWIIFYNSVASCNVTNTAKYFNITRKTLHKWLKRFDEKNLKSLEENSRSPDTKRTWTVTFEEQERIKRLIFLSNNEIVNIHHDNGSEFEKHFEQACKNLSINQIYSRVRTPKDNSALERFNYTIQDEWLGTSEVGLENIQEANIDLTNWLLTYNNLRPHEALDYNTPLEYATLNFKVSPMWAARTCC